MVASRDVRTAIPSDPPCMIRAMARPDHELPQPQTETRCRLGTPALQPFNEHMAQVGEEDQSTDGWDGA